MDAFSREHYKGGVLISGKRFADACARTTEAIDSGARRLYQAAFSTEGGGCRVDILDREANGSWTVREVKMSTKLKNEHVPDAAFQVAMLKECGLDVAAVLIVHVNNQAIAPRLDGYFAEEDITGRVDEYLPRLYDLARQFDVSLRGAEPNIRVGKHCDNPYPCAFRDRCWKRVPRTSVFTIPRISATRLENLLDAGIWDVHDIPPKADLTANNWSYVHLHRDGPQVDFAGLRAWLAELEYPLHFLDFETANPPILRHDGARPYMQVPFQFSCHVLSGDGQLENHHYLHPDGSDPREPLVAALREAVGPDGHVLVYNETFERGRLQELAVALPHHSGSAGAGLSR